MNRCFFLLLIIITISSNLSFAQSPQAIPYQAIIRGVNGVPIVSSPVNIRFTIHDSIASGTVIYQELHLIKGNLISGTFSLIDWSKNEKYIQVEVDATQSGNFIDLGTTQFLSVPYALYAEISGNQNGFKHYIGEQFGGGVIFHLYKDVTGTEHGLIVSIADLGNAVWGTEGADIPGTLNYTDGKVNTLSIVQNEVIINTAARLCFNYRGGGFDDWYLPSIEELLLIYKNRFDINNSLKNINNYSLIFSMEAQLNSPNQTINNYWSSTQVPFNASLAHNLAFGFTFNNIPYSCDFGPKSTVLQVRAIRKF